METDLGLDLERGTELMMLSSMPQVSFVSPWNVKIDKTRKYSPSRSSKIMEKASVKFGLPILDTKDEIRRNNGTVEATVHTCLASHQVLSTWKHSLCVD